jgi:hypothetical protein
VRNLGLKRREQLLALALTHQRGRSDSAAAERRQAVRAANETIYNQIEPHRERLHQPDMSCCFLCECGRSGCLEPLLLSLDHYQSLRTTPDRYLVAPDHIDDEQVEAWHGGYAVISTRGGA